MSTRVWILLAALSASAAQAQQPAPAQRSGRSAQARQQQLRESIAQMDRILTQLREMNQWLAGQHTCDACLDMGREMEQTGGQLRSLFQQLEVLHKDPHLAPHPARMADVDALHARLREMMRRLDEARIALRKVAGG